MKDICHKIKGWYDKVYIFSSTVDVQPDLFDFVDKDCIILGYNEQLLIQIWNKQKELIVKLKKLKTKEEDLPKILILYDDLVSDRTFRKSEIFERLFVAGRHIWVAQIFITQMFTGVPKDIRTNVDVAIAFFLENERDRESFSISYLSTRNRRIGILLFDKVTKEPFQSIVVLGSKITQSPNDYVRKYVASMTVPKFKMGRPEKFVHKYINGPYGAFDNKETFVPKTSGGGIKI
jgi:hypothetical protein